MVINDGGICVEREELYENYSKYMAMSVLIYPSWFRD